jgi:hypothetical protein
MYTTICFNLVLILMQCFFSSRLWLDDVYIFMASIPQLMPSERRRKRRHKLKDLTLLILTAFSSEYIIMEIPVLFLKLCRHQFWFDGRKYNMGTRSPFCYNRQYAIKYQSYMHASGIITYYTVYRFVWNIRVIQHKC